MPGFSLLLFYFHKTLFLLFYFHKTPFNQNTPQVFVAHFYALLEQRTGKSVALQIYLKV